MEALLRVLRRCAIKLNWWSIYERLVDATILYRRKRR